MKRQDITEKKIHKIMTFLDFDLKGSKYECGTNSITKKSLIDILESFDFKQDSFEWYNKGKESINVNHLVRVVELIRIIDRD